MSIDRYFVRDLDTTTTGGTVQARPQQWPVTYGDDAKHACFEGDPVYCPACESTGVTQCVPPYRPNTGPDGRQATLDGDLCLCKCPIPPRVIARSRNNTMSFEAHEIAGLAGSGAWMAYAGHRLADGSNDAGPYDEQMCLSSDGVHGLAYRIEVGDGRVLCGTIGADGLLPRIQTSGEAEYTVYWGDEALARTQGESS